jgi:hypothetical protein
MQNNRFAGLLAGGLMALSGLSWAGVPGAVDATSVENDVVAAAARPAVLSNEARRNEALIELHRAATGAFFLRPVLAETAVRCCEPSRASR